MTRRALTSLTAAITLAASVPGAQAQEESGTASTDPADIKFNQALRSLTEPESPTFQLLGVGANDVSRPESPKQAALSILNSLDQNGNLQSGLAMEFSPYLLFAGDRLTLDDYQRDGWRRQLSYLQIGLGTSKGASDNDKSLKASIGIVWTPINGMDPYVHQKLTACLKNVVGTPIEPPPDSDGPPAAAAKPATSQETGAGRIASKAPAVRGEASDEAARIAGLEERVAQLEALLKRATSSNTAPPLAQLPQRTALSDAPPQRRTSKAVEIEAANACFAANPLLPDNTTSLQFGFAPLFVSETGKTADLKARGYAASALLTLGLSRIDPAIPKDLQYRSQLILSATYRHSETIPDPDVKDAFLTRNRWSAGGRFVYGRPTSVFYSLEGVYQDSRYRDGRSDRYVTIVGGVDLRVAEGLWLGLSAGTSAGRSIGGDSTFIGSRFRWGFGQKSSIGAEFKPVDAKE
jgi:hypothetical protein